MRKNIISCCSGICLSAMLVFSPPVYAEKANKTKEMLYIGGYDYVFAVDPETKKVKDIPVKGPARNIAWTEDGHKVFVVTEGRRTVSIIDTSKNKVIDNLSYSSGNVISRIYGMTVDSKGEKIYATVMRTKREGTKLEPLQPAILVMDVKKRKVVKEIEVPWGVHELQMYKDDKRIAVWGRDLYVYDIEKDELKVLKKVAHPDRAEDGIGNVFALWARGADSHDLSVVTNYQFYPETEAVTEGILTLDLTTGDVKEHEFKGVPVGLMSGAVTKDRKTAYLGMNHLAKVNLETGEYEKVVMHEPGTSYGYNISGDDQTVYVSGAGPDLSFYDAKTLKHLDTIDLKSDTMDVRVIQIQQP